MASNIDLKQMIPDILKIDFWNDLMDVLSEELEILKTEVAKKENFYNTRELNDENDLLNIAYAYGFIPDRSIDDSIDWLKFEIESIPFKIKYKTTYIGYEYIFKSISKEGDIFIYYYNNFNLVKIYKDYESSDTDSLNSVTDYSLPFNLKAERENLYLYFENFILDDDPVLYLDGEGEYAWYLDQSNARIKTQHIGIEYFINDIIIEDNEEYLINSTYLDFIRKGTFFNYDIKDIPHVGASLSLITDQSQRFDNHIILDNMFGYALNESDKTEDFTTWTKSNPNITITYSTIQLNDIYFSKINLDSGSYTSMTINDDFSISSTSEGIGASTILKRSNIDYTTFIIYEHTTGVNTYIEIKVDWNLDTVTLVEGSKLIYEWIDSDTVLIGAISNLVSSTPYNYGASFTFGVDSGNLPVNSYGYASALTVVNKPSIPHYFKNEWGIDSDSNYVNHNFIFETLTNGQFSLKIKLKNVKFHWSLTSTRVLMNIGSVQISYDTTTQRFFMTYNGSHIQTDQFDDGTSLENLYQDSIILMFVFNDSDPSTGCHIYMSSESGFFDYSTWLASNPASLGLDIESLLIDLENNNPDCDIEYLKLWEGLPTGSITSETEFDSAVSLNNLIIDKTFNIYQNYLDGYNQGNSSMPIIKTNSVITPSYDSYINTFTPGSKLFIQIGSGSYNIPSKYNNSISWPTGVNTYETVEQPISTKELYLDHYILDKEFWDLFFEEFNGKTINNYLLFKAVNGDDWEFSDTFWDENHYLYNCLPLLKGHVKISFINNGFKQTLIDKNSNGTLYSNDNYILGTIDYDTTEINLTLEKNISNELVNEGTITILTTFLNNFKIKPGSLTITYWIGGEQYQATNDSTATIESTITGSYINTGYIRMKGSSDEGKLYIEFDVPTDSNKDIYVDYIYILPPDEDSSIYLEEAWVTNDFNITEVGILSDNAKNGLPDFNTYLSAYANFPIISLNNNKHNISFNFFVYKFLFNSIEYNPTISGDITFSGSGNFYLE